MRTCPLSDIKAYPVTTQENIQRSLCYSEWIPCPTFANSRVLDLRGSFNSLNAKFNLMSMRFNIVPRVEEVPTDAETIEQIFVLLECVEELRNASSPRDQAQFIINS